MTVTIQGSLFLVFARDFLPRVDVLHFTGTSYYDVGCLGKSPHTFLDFILKCGRLKILYTGKKSSK